KLGCSAAIADEAATELAMRVVAPALDEMIVGDGAGVEAASGHGVRDAVEARGWRRIAADTDTRVPRGLTPGTGEHALVAAVPRALGRVDRGRNTRSFDAGRVGGTFHVFAYFPHRHEDPQVLVRDESKCSAGDDAPMERRRLALRLRAGVYTCHDANPDLC